MRKRGETLEATCVDCGEDVIRGRKGYRRKLSVPLPLTELYKCSANASRKAKGHRIAP